MTLKGRSPIRENLQISVEFGGAGDSIVVPAGVDHKLQKLDGGQPLEVVGFMVKPGLVEEMREMHRSNNGQFAASLEQLNEIANKYGTHYKSFD